MPPKRLQAAGGFGSVVSFQCLHCCNYVRIFVNEEAFTGREEDQGQYGPDRSFPSRQSNMASAYTSRGRSQDFFQRVRAAFFAIS
jgi:hypothetical protein